MKIKSFSEMLRVLIRVTVCPVLVIIFTNSNAFGQTPAAKNSEKTGVTNAINPQPLPPKVTHKPGDQNSINPQPLPPKYWPKPMTKNVATQHALTHKKSHKAIAKNTSGTQHSSLNKTQH